MEENRTTCDVNRLGIQNSSVSKCEKNINLVKMLSVFFWKVDKAFFFPKQGQSAVSVIVSAMLLGKYLLCGCARDLVFLRPWGFFPGFCEIRGTTTASTTGTGENSKHSQAGYFLPAVCRSVSFPRTSTSATTTSRLFYFRCGRCLLAKSKLATYFPFVNKAKTATVS